MCSVWRCICVVCGGVICVVCGGVILGVWCVGLHVCSVY